MTQADTFARYLTDKHWAPIQGGRGRGEHHRQPRRSEMAFGVKVNLDLTFTMVFGVEVHCYPLFMMVLEVEVHFYTIFTMVLCLEINWS